MRMKKGILGVTVALAVAGLGLWSGTTASANFNVWYNGADALTHAPQGVYLGSGTASDYFSIDKNVSNADGTNAANLVDAGSPAGTGNSAIQISKAGNDHSWGSIWSKQQSFDLNKNESASMWIYASGENASNIGDGMAFVLQNGGTGVYSGSGQSMGVWGVPDSLYAKQDPAKSAIPNSWALEFDTYPNKDIPPQETYSVFDPLHLEPIPSTFDFVNKAPSTFDVNGDGGSPKNQTPITDTHIASNYPADTNTYSGTSVLGNGLAINPLTGHKIDHQGTFYYYNMQHKGFLDEGATGGGGNLSDHRWHHITVDYTPPTTTGGDGSMTYTYNDKDPDTGLPINSNDYATVPIKLSEFNLADGQSKVRWGFTGSTGAYTENNLVIFDQLPGEAQTEASATMTTKDGAGDYTKRVDAGDSVPGSSDVKLTYTLERTGGDEDWKAVNGDLTIPDDIDVTSGAIDYPDASYKDSNNNKVDVSKIVAPTSAGAGQKLMIPLANNGLTLSGTQKATVTLYGKTKDVASKSDVSEASQTSYFVGSNATSTAKTPSFTITKKVNPALEMQIDESSSVLKVNAGGTKDANIVGVAVPSDKTMLSSTITIHPTVDGEAKESINLAGSSYFGELYSFQYSVDSSKLTAGNHVISFYATDAVGDRSASVSTTVTAGTVGFGHTSGDMTFKPTALTGSGTQVVNRDGDWSLDVDDSLVDQSTWQVTANTAGMFAKDTAVSTPLDGSLFYTDSSGKETTLNESASPIIATGESDGTDSSTNIAKNWTDDTGIRLKVNSGAVEGVYQGTIDWSFVNSVKTTG